MMKNLWLLLLFSPAFAVEFDAGTCSTETTTGETVEWSCSEVIVTPPPPPPPPPPVSVRCVGLGDSYTDPNQFGGWLEVACGTADNHAVNGDRTDEIYDQTISHLNHDQANDEYFVYFLPNDANFPCNQDLQCILDRIDQYMGATFEALANAGVTADRVNIFNIIDGDLLNTPNVIAIGPVAAKQYTDMMNAALSEAAARSGYGIYDLNAFMRQLHSEVGSSMFGGDGKHFTDATNQAIGDHVSAEIL